HTPLLRGTTATGKWVVVLGGGGPAESLGLASARPLDPASRRIRTLHAALRGLWCGLAYTVPRRSSFSWAERYAGEQALFFFGTWIGAPVRAGRGRVRRQPGMGRDLPTRSGPRTRRDRVRLLARRQRAVQQPFPLPKLKPGRANLAGSLAEWQGLPRRSSIALLKSGNIQCPIC